MPRLSQTLTLREAELELRRLGPDDRDAVRRSCQDPEILDWTTLPDPFTDDAVDSLLEEIATRWAEGTGVELGITVEGHLAGAVGITFYGDWRASVAYWLAPEARGRGLATRSVRLLTAWAFDTFEALVRIELWSIVGNVASDAVARRSGFSEEGILRSRLPYRGGYRDVRCFSLLRGE